MRARLLVAVASLLFALNVKAEHIPQFPTDEELVDLLYSGDAEILNTEVHRSGSGVLTAVTIIKSLKYGLVTCFQDKDIVQMTYCKGGQKRK